MDSGSLNFISLETYFEKQTSLISHLFMLLENALDSEFKYGVLFPLNQEIPGSNLRSWGSWSIFEVDSVRL